MLISFAEAKKLLAKYAGKAGKCDTDVEVPLFVKSVIQELLNRGANGSVRKWQFYTQNGTITAPPDLLLPIKIRIDGPCGSAMQGFVYDKFYEFYDESTLQDCQPWEKGAVEEPNNFYTQYDLPLCGARILAVPRCNEAEDANLVIQGTNLENQDIWMPLKEGGKKKGEHLSICKAQNKFTEATFVSISGIEKTPTKDYVRLYWYIPETGMRGILAEFRPNETRPAFKRFRILGVDCNAPFKVTILGRVRFFDNYADSDIIPITSIRALKLMAQTLQADDNDNVQVSSYKESRVDKVLDTENRYNRTPQAKVDFEEATSPGSIKNLI